MSLHCCEFFSSWPYDEALKWMVDAEGKVKKNNTLVLLGCGSHRETVITLGRNNSKNDVKASLVEDVMIRHIERGGGATAHEPGQLVLYPVFNIDQFRLSVLELVSLMEDTILDFLQDRGIRGHRSSLGPGIFVDERKVGFIGLRIKDRVTSHGLSVNLKNDGEIFSRINPCGIPSLSIASVSDFVLLDDHIECYMQLLAEKFIEKLFAHLDIKSGLFLNSNRNQL